MGNYVSVDLDKLKSAKSSLLLYQMSRDKIISQMDSEVDSAVSAWTGDDSTSFHLKWNGMYSPGGFFTEVGDGVENYRKLLSAAYKLYKKAQSESVEQASKVNSW